MIKFYANSVCGCCQVEMSFKNEKRIKQAFEKAGLSSSATIVDDLGEVHEGVDSFYGYTSDDSEKRGIGYLVSQAGFIMK